MKLKYSKLSYPKSGSNDPITALLSGDWSLADSWAGNGLRLIMAALGSNTRFLFGSYTLSLCPAQSFGSDT